MSKIALAVTVYMNLSHTIHNNSEIEGELDMISCKSSFRLIQLKVKLICYIDSLHAK